MSTLGTTGTGATFTIGGSFGQAAGGPYTVPSPGIIVSQIHVFIDNNNSTGEIARAYIWQDNGGVPGMWCIRDSNTGTLNAPPLTWDVSTPGGLVAQAGSIASSDLYLPAGSSIWIGYYASNGISQFGSPSTTTGGSWLGNTQDGNWNNHGQATGIGHMSAYIDYTALPAPTISGASPSVAAPGSSVVLTGTAFLHASGITCCGVTVSSYTINSDTQITMTVPAGAAGAGTIVVTNPAGSASTAFTAGTIYCNPNGTVGPLKNIWVPNGSGGVKQVVGVWVPNGSGGVKRIW